MHVLYVHQNYPAQFGHIADRLARRHGFRCTFVNRGEPGDDGLVRRVQYRLQGGATDKTHPLLRSYENYTWHSHAVYTAMKAHAHIRPDLVVGHSGFGSTLFLADLYDCPIINMYEWYYQPDAVDEDFLRPRHQDEVIASRARSAMLLSDLQSCTLGYCPMHWQRSRFPHEWQPKLATVFDGVPTEFWRRRSQPAGLPRKFGEHTLPADKKIVTYVSRGFESMRGFHVFMDVAHQIVRARKDVVVVCVGSDRVCYGGDLDRIKEPSFREHVTRRYGEPHERIVFTGVLQPPDLVNLFSLSDLHVYLTAPFVLSWSLLDAMSCGCTILASETPPLMEVIEHGRNGLLAPFHDADRFVELAMAVLDDPRGYRRALGEAAVETIDRQYSLDRIIPQMIALYERASKGSPRGPNNTESARTFSVTGSSNTEQPAAPKGLPELAQRFTWPSIAALPARRLSSTRARRVLDRRELRAALSPDARLIIELGAWRGTITKLLAAYCPRATIVAVDAWPGCRQEGSHPEWKAQSEDSLRSFAMNCNGAHSRVVPVLAAPLEGLPLLSSLDLEPDYVYLSITCDSTYARHLVRRTADLFPAAVMLGDHWGWWGIRRAVGATAESLSRPVTIRAGFWRLDPAATPAWQVPTRNTGEAPTQPVRSEFGHFEQNSWSNVSQSRSERLESSPVE